MHLIPVLETASTNDLLKQLLSESSLEEGTVVTTQLQSKGRGQINNSWEAEPGRNLTFSLLLKPTFIRPAEQFIISQAVALGVVDALSAKTSGLSIKWPNDIYWKNRKIAGILIENQLTGNVIDSCIVGIGININQEQFVSDAPNPVSLKQITGQEYRLDELLSSVVSSILIRYKTIKGGEVDDLRLHYLSHLYLKGRKALFKDAGGLFEGTITGVRSSGHLEIEDRRGETRLYAFKEVAFIREETL